ncbi:MAG TPA: hypothetical protein VIX59_09225 [Candidatus Binataceae bacterium]
MASQPAPISVGAEASDASLSTWSPIVENRPSRNFRAPFKIVALNARGGSRLDAIARCLSQPPLAGASLILLSEANRLMFDASGREFAAELAARLGMSVAYLPEFALQREGGKIFAYMGNALLSAEPIEELVAIPTPSRKRIKWRFLRSSKIRKIGTSTGFVASTRLGGERVHVGVAHLDSRCTPSIRERQMTTFLARFPATGRAILGGDLNTTTTELLTARGILSMVARMLVSSRRFRYPESYEPLFDRIRERGLEIRGANAIGRPTFTFSRIIPPWMRPKLDWIALRDLRPVAGSAAVVAAQPSFFSLRASDHDFITVEVDF